MSSTCRRVYVHLIWGTKRRARVIDACREQLIESIFAAKAVAQRCEMIAFGGVDDHVHVHVHVLVVMHPSANVATLVRAMKSHTTHEIERTDHRDPPFGWQRGHAMLSVEPNGAAELRHYISNQKVHHADETTRAA